MTCGVQMHDVVALLDDMPARHFETAKALLLRRGQIGTVVMSYEGNVFEVEFAAPDGRTYALLPVEAGKLMVLHDTYCRGTGRPILGQSGISAVRIAH